MDTKKIGTGKAGTASQKPQNVLEVIKPFVNFGVRALGILGHTLVYIIKNIPKPTHRQTAEKKNDQVIKI